MNKCLPLLLLKQDESLILDVFGTRRRTVSIRHQLVAASSPSSSTLAQHKTDKLS